MTEMLKMKTHRTSSSQATKKVAEKLAREIVSRQKSETDGRKATVIALYGDLGAGKTTFTQGFLRALGVKKRIASPTFILFRQYAIRGERYANIYHIDAYRLKKSKDLLDLGFKEILADPKNLILIEWPENVKGILPRSVIRIKFRHGEKENEREIAL